MPNIFKRGEIYHCDISIAGKQIRKSTGTKDRKEAEEFYQAERERLWREHKLGDKGCIRWKEIAARYIAEADGNKKRDIEILTWFATYLDHEPVNAITAKVVEQLRQLKLKEGVTRTTVNRHMTTFRAVLRKCVEWDHLTTIPKVPMFEVRASEKRWLTPEEFNKLREHLPEHLKLAADMAVYTGLRIGSMLKLTWDRINLETAHAWVPGQQMKSGNPFGIQLNEGAVKTLRALRELNPEGNRVFQWKNQPIKYCAGAAWRAAVKAAGLAPLRWHDLRHTWASWAAQAGLTTQEIMDLGGWKSYSMVLNYSHLSPAQSAIAANKVSAYLAQSQTQSAADASNDEEFLKFLRDLGLGRVGLEPTTNALKGRCSTD